MDGDRPAGFPAVALKLLACLPPQCRELGAGKGAAGLLGQPVSGHGARCPWLPSHVAWTNAMPGAPVGLKMS